MWLREHKLIVGIAVGLIALAIAAAFLKKEPTLRLADGTELTIRRAAYDRTNRWISGPVWKRMISGLAPAIRIPPALRTQSWSMTDTNEVLFVWIESRYKGTNANSVPPVVAVVAPATGLEAAPVAP